LERPQTRWPAHHRVCNPLAEQGSSVRAKLPFTDFAPYLTLAVHGEQKKNLSVEHN
jgi:hypothetical protein